MVKSSKLSTSLLVTILIIVMAGCNAIPQLSAPLVAAPAAQTSQTQNVSAVTTAPAAITSAADLEQAYVSVYEKVNPSVVSIQVIEQATTQRNSQNPNTPTIPGMPNIPNLNEIPTSAVGSGFIYDTEGHIVTNNHVVAGASSIMVIFADGTEAEAKVIGTDPESDLAVIQVSVDKALLKPVTLVNAANLKVGQIVIAIGNPYGLQNSMSTGIISGLGRMLESGSSTRTSGTYSIPNMIQTDAAINPGNSGGPLFNLQGEVIGVNTAIESPVRASSGVGYAVSAAIVNQVVPMLLSNGKVETPWLGVSGTTLNSSLAKAMNLDANQRGVLVIELVAQSPAEKAGLKASTQKATIDGIETPVGGDVIVGVNNQSVKVFDDLLGYLVGKTKVGDTITLKVLREGKTIDVSVTLAARPVS